MSLRLIFSLGFAAGLGLGPVVRSGAQEAAGSPFIPASAAGAAAAATADGTSYELRGVMTTARGTRFCIYDPTKKTGVWVGLNERGHTFVVSSADASNTTVSIQAQDGRRLMLAMRQGKVVSGGPMQMMPQQQASGPPALVGNVALHPTPETEQARLQAITDEVRRRRLLREQAQNGQAIQPQPAGAPQQH